MFYLILVKTLKLTLQPDNVVVNALGGIPPALSRSRVQLKLKSAHDTNFYLKISALVLKSLISTPSQEIVLPSWKPFNKLDVADSAWKLPAEVDCILNAEVSACTIRIESVLA